MSYDEAGNVTNGYDATYRYDGTGMVTGATVCSDIRDFVYTADDERIAVRRGASWSWTVRDQSGKVLREFTSLETAAPFGLTSHNWSRDYVWRDGLLLASVFPTTPGSPGTTTYHCHLDHLGTPRLVTTDGGVIVGKHTYYPFGAEMDLTPKETSFELMKFTGHERDIVAGDNHSVDYMHARMYNPNLGRFLEVDPTWDSADVSRPQAWNRYSYVNNNPMSHVDPNGRNPLGALLGGAIGVSIESWRQVQSGEPVNNGRLIAALAGGAASGAIGGLGHGLRAAILLGGMGGAAGHIVEHQINGDQISPGGVARSVIAGSVAGAIGNVTGRAFVGASSNSGALNEATWKAVAERADASAVNAGLGADSATVRQATTIVKGLAGAGDAAGQSAQAKVDQELNTASVKRAPDDAQKKEQQ